MQATSDKGTLSLLSPEEMDDFNNIDLELDAQTVHLSLICYCVHLYLLLVSAFPCILRLLPYCLQQCLFLVCSAASSLPPEFCSILSLRLCEFTHTVCTSIILCNSEQIHVPLLTICTYNLDLNCPADTCPTIPLTASDGNGSTHRK